MSWRQVSLRYVVPLVNGTYVNIVYISPGLLFSLRETQNQGSRREGVETRGTVDNDYKQISFRIFLTPELGCLNWRFLTVVLASKLS